MQDEKNIHKNLDLLTESNSLEEKGNITTSSKYILFIILTASAVVVSYFLIENVFLTPSVKLGKVILIDNSSIISRSANLEAVGYVVAKNKANISSEVVGTVVQLNFEEGDLIRKGEVIARIDSKLAYKSLQISKAEIAVSKANLEEAKILVKEAKQRLMRISEMVKKGYLSDQSHDDAQAKFNAANARLASVSAQEQLSEKSNELAQASLEKHIIKAPFSGVVVKKDVYLGEYVSPTTSNQNTKSSICTIVDMNSLEVEVDVNETYIHKVFLDQPVEIRFVAIPDTIIESTVSEISKTADRAQATVKVKIPITTQHENILPEMAIRVKFYKNQTNKNNEAASSIYIPKDAVQSDGNETYVWQVVDYITKKRTLSLGAIKDKYIEVTSGLNAGEQVVLEFDKTLKDGQKIKVIN